MLFGTYQREEEKPTYGITKSFNSWNPVWANFDHYQFMLSEMKFMKLPDMIKYLVKKPGWRPDSMGGARKVQAVDKETFRKFDTSSYRSINFYVLFQYVLAMLATALFLFNKTQFTLNESALVVGLIIITIVNCGALFEGTNWILVAENVRITIFSAIAFYFSFVNNWDVLFLIGGIAYLAISTVWLHFSRLPKRSPIHV